MVKKLSMYVGPHDVYPTMDVNFSILTRECKNKKLVDNIFSSNFVLLSMRESLFGKVTRLPSRFQRSLCRGGLVHGSLPTFYCFIGETNCRLASVAEMRLCG